MLEKHMKTKSIISVIILLALFSIIGLFWLKEKRQIQEEFNAIDKVYRESDSLMIDRLNALYKKHHGKSAAYLGHYYLGLNDTAKARDYFQKSIDFNEEMLGNYGLALIAGDNEIVRWSKINEEEILNEASKKDDWIWKSRYFSLSMAGYLTGNLDTANVVNLLTKSAEMGNRDAQFKLGSFYFLYYTNDYDKAKSYNWMLKAANSGHVEAQTRLGSILEYGHGTMISYEEAFKYYLMAAESGDPEAQFHVGRFYMTGQGVNMNAELGEAWLIESSNNGFTLAEELLNSRYVDCPRCHGTGWDVCKDCNGRGTRHCRACDGYRKDRYGKTCLSCDGRGLVSCNTEVQCKMCYGYGRGVLEQCTSCNGTGQIRHKDGSTATCGEHFNDLLSEYIIGGLAEAFGETKNEMYCGGDGYVFRAIKN